MHKPINLPALEKYSSKKKQESSLLRILSKAPDPSIGWAGGRIYVVS